MKYLITALLVFVVTLVLASVGFCIIQGDLVSLKEAGQVSSEALSYYRDLEKGVLGFFFVFGILMPLGFVLGGLK